MRKIINLFMLFMIFFGTVVPVFAQTPTDTPTPESTITPSPTPIIYLESKGQASTHTGYPYLQADSVDQWGIEGTVSCDVAYLEYFETMKCYFDWTGYDNSEYINGNVSFRMYFNGPSETNLYWEAEELLANYAGHGMTHQLFLNDDPVNDVASGTMGNVAYDDVIEMLFYPPTPGQDVEGAVHVTAEICISVNEMGCVDEPTPTPTPTSIPGLECEEQCPLYCPIGETCPFPCPSSPRYICSAELENITPEGFWLSWPEYFIGVVCPPEGQEYDGTLWSEYNFDCQLHDCSHINLIYDSCAVAVTPTPVFGPPPEGIPPVGGPGLVETGTNCFLDIAITEPFTLPMGILPVFGSQNLGINQVDVDVCVVMYEIEDLKVAGVDLSGLIVMMAAAVTLAPLFFIARR